VDRRDVHGMSARVESRRADGRSRSLPQRLHDGAGESANKSAQIGVVGDAAWQGWILRLRAG
jgi:hypothetical protein